MYNIMEEIINNEKRESALIMLADGELSLERIAKYSGLTLEQVKELSQTILRLAGGLYLMQ